MKPNRIFAITLAAAAAFSVSAQPSVPRQADAAAGATKAPDCSVLRKARHDHGIERGYGPMPLKGCSIKTADAGQRAPVAGHDHGKFHKNQ